MDDTVERWKRRAIAIERLGLGHGAYDLALDGIVRKRPGVLKNYAIDYGAATEIVGIVAELLVPNGRRVVEDSDVLTEFDRELVGKMWRLLLDEWSGNGRGTIASDDITDEELNRIQEITRGE